MKKKPVRHEPAPTRRPARPAPARSGQPFWKSLIEQHRLLTEFLVILALSFVTYGNSIVNDYNIDDGYVVSLDEGNKQTEKGIWGIPELLTSKYSQGPGVTYGYRPFGKITMAIEYSLWGNEPNYSHFVNVLLFAVNVLLLLVFMRKVAAWMNYRNDPVIYLAILLFIVHPIHTEVVDSIKNREEILCFGFMLGALLTWFRFWEIQDRFKRAGLVLVFVIFILLSVLSKQTGFNILGVMGLLVAYRLLVVDAVSWKWRELIRDRRFQLAVFFMVVTFMLLDYILNKLPASLPDDDIANKFEVNPYNADPGTDRWPKAVGTLLFYAGKLLVPFPLLYYYGYDMLPVRGWNTVYPYIGLLLFFAVLGGLYFLIRFRKAYFPAFWIAFTLLTILPFANMGSVFFYVVGIVGERMAYQASAGYCLLLAMGLWALAGWIKQRYLVDASISATRLALVFIAVFAVPYFLLTLVRNTQWKDKTTLYEHDIKWLERSARANYMLGSHIMNKIQSGGQVQTGNEAELARVRKHFQQALQIYPRFNDALLGLGTLYAAYFAMPDSAMLYLEKVDTVSRYTYVKARERMGDVQYDGRRYEQALDYYRQAFVRYPENYPVYQKIIDLLLSDGRYRQILSLSDTAILNGWPEGYVNKGDALLNLQDTTQAVANYELAVKNGLKSDVLIRNLEYYYRLKGMKEKLNLLPR